jgi:hypothetical protein
VGHPDKVADTDEAKDWVSRDGGVVVSTVKEVTTSMVRTSAVIAPSTIRRHLSLRLCRFSRVAFSSRARVPSFHFSLRGSTLTNGVPSARQNAN